MITIVMKDIKMTENLMERSCKNIIGRQIFEGVRILKHRKIVILYHYHDKIDKIDDRLPAMCNTKVSNNDLLSIRKWLQ